MTKVEYAVWSEPGEQPRRGLVIKRGGARAAVLVQWDGGLEQRVGADQAVKYAFAGTQRLDWLLNPGQVARQFRSDATSTIICVIRDEGKPITSTMIKRRLVELGLDVAAVDGAFAGAKADLRRNEHIVIRGATHAWSDTPVDPHAELRGLPPHVALDRLLATSPRLTAEQKQALGDAIRAGLVPRA